MKRETQVNVVHAYNLPFELPGSLANLENGQQTLTPLQIGDTVIPLLKAIQAGLFCLNMAALTEDIELYPRAWRPLAQHLEQQIGIAVQLLNRMQV